MSIIKIEKATPFKWKMVTGILGYKNYAVAFFSNIYLHPKKATPPDFVMKFIIAHETGHVTNKDSIRLLFLVILLLSSMILTLFSNFNNHINSGAFYELIFLEYISFWLIRWLVVRESEKKADQIAVNQIGYNSCVKALDWLEKNSDQSEKEMRKRRLEKFISSFKCENN